eukprot:767335-Hanusia_phi.AAC.5
MTPLVDTPHPYAAYPTLVPFLTAEVGLLKAYVSNVSIFHEGNFKARRLMSMILPPCQLSASRRS